VIAWVVWVAVALVTLAVAALAVVVLRDRSRRREELAAAYAVIAGLEERVETLALMSRGFETSPSGSSSATGHGPSTTGATSGGDGGAIVITRLTHVDGADESAASADHRIDGSLFADLVLRESLVKGVSLAYGIGRALSPETRNRIRFLMRQEVKRSRKQRRADLRAARRHLADVQRAEVDQVDHGEDAA
jgi:hypothetical protein